MRIRRLKLENWRGVKAREIEFAEGVTIIEGPNEAGKTSIIEALFTLINELDSSNKQAIKAVQPVGRDVGSFVEAEIQSGEYRFVYAKSYNRNKSTSLKIDAPRAGQLTGREAHECVIGMLEETVDLDLWKALLVDQGARVDAVKLPNEGNLAAALDAAAGGEAPGAGDEGLLTAAQAEYEKYFTLKTGKPKKEITDIETALADAERTCAEARAALDAVEQEATDFERLEADISRRNEELPKLEKSLAQHEASKQTADKLKSELRLKEQQLESVRDQQKNAERARTERRELMAQIEVDEKALVDARQVIDPMKARLEEFDKRAAKARGAIEAHSKSRRDAAQALELAREDEAYIRSRIELADLEKLAQNLSGISKDLETALETVNSIAIDEQGINALRKAEHDLSVARSKRDLAATAVRISADRNLDLDVGGESVSVASGGSIERSVATDLDIRLPGVASIRVSPPKSAVSLEDELEEAGEVIDRLLRKFDVGSLEEAVEAQARKQAARQEVERLEARSADLLGERSEQELAREMRTLKTRCESYLANRDSESGLPADATEAASAIEAAKKALAAEAQALEANQANERQLRREREQIAQAQGEVQSRLIGLEATLREKAARLGAAREQATDDALDQHVRDIANSVESIEKDVATLQRKLDELSPDSIDALYDNAKAAAQRAARDRAEAERNRAVLHDRLERARADGRFENLDAAERRRDEISENLEAARRRAAAAQRLWQTLNRHRDEAHRTYVRPLKEAIERLGRIVFGPDFEITIADDWTPESRTLEGITLPYGELSAGAKEQLGILTRLAAARIVSSRGGVPLIIDDALGFSDPVRLETMGAAISAAGNDCQVIILTCTPGRFTHVGNAAVVGL